MDNLKWLFLDLGLLKVKTYIQSGNVVFETTLAKTSLQNIIYAGFVERFGFKSDVTIRTINEIKALIDELSIFAAELAAAEAANPQVEHLYVYFLDHSPEQPQIDNICKEYAGPDILRAGKREVYLLCHQSVRESKLAIHTAKVFDSATVRNWKTVIKLYNMMASL